MTDTWNQLRRPTPEWYRNAPFGIFIHWGPYSVPAWAEPSGELGADGVVGEEWFTHNAYSEWYYNTIRIEGSPAWRHHQEVYGGADYDDFLDAWKAESFDARELIDLVVSAGADYVVPTTKHHDGVALWDAPETGTRNTVHRGPRRDLIGEIAGAARERGIRLGLYYSGGLDWHVRHLAPHLDERSVQDTGRPKDAEFARYVYVHFKDLIDRFEPDILWNDINWPEEGKHFGEHGIGELFRYYYERHPEGLVNDRFGKDVHYDYATSEYQHMLDSEAEEQWEHCRGIGLSFAYNRNEGSEHLLDGPAIARHLADIVCRGGHFLLNIGPKADGTVPAEQRQALEILGQWMKVAKPTLPGAASATQPTAGEGGWARALQTAEGALAVYVDRPDGSAGTVELHGVPDGELTSLEPAWGRIVSQDAGRVVVELSAGRPGPVVLRA